MSEPYEINVDPDLANHDTLTIFITYRVLDYQQRFIGATGIGLTVDTVNRLIDDYDQRYGRTVFLADATGKISLSGKSPVDAHGHARLVQSSIHAIEGLREQAQTILSRAAAPLNTRTRASIISSTSVICPNSSGTFLSSSPKTAPWMVFSASSI